MIYYGNELYHHGIKGQKWGIRNYQNEDGSYTDKGQSDNNGTGRYNQSANFNSDQYRSEMMKKSKNTYQKNFYENATIEELKYDSQRKERINKILLTSAAVVGISAAVYLAYRYNVTDKLKTYSITNSDDAKDIMKNSLEDLVIPKGSEIHRIVGEEGIDFSQIKNPIYTSWTEGDVRAYRRLLVDHFHTGKKVEVCFEASEDIVVPSKSTVQKIFNDLYYSKEDPSYRDALAKTLEDSGLQMSMFNSYGSAKDSKEFKAAMYALVKKKEDSKIFLSLMKEKGYSAIEDYFDKGTLGESPLIVIDPSKSLQKIGENIVTSLGKAGDIDYLVDTGHVSVKEYVKTYGTFGARTLLKSAVK